MQKIESKRQVEESICEVAGNEKPPPLESVPEIEQEEQEKEFVFQNQQDVEMNEPPQQHDELFI